MDCKKAAAVFYWGFRNDPMFKWIPPQRAYALFEFLVSLAEAGHLLLLCTKVGSVTVAAALVEAGLRGPLSLRSLGLAARALAPLLFVIFIKAVKALALTPKFSSIYSRVPKPCHLLLIASLAPGRGYGSKLLSLVERVCRRLGRSHVILEVDAKSRAVRFYARHGYRPLASVPVAKMEVLVMVKELA